ncbi:Uncharacterised protein [Jonesia denitrificans]|nr:Uncharacterised protein [Jonesia denitrificans]
MPLHYDGYYDVGDAATDNGAHDGNDRGNSSDN